jgi:ribosomal protein L37AE/L43A
MKKASKPKQGMTCPYCHGKRGKRYPIFGWIACKQCNKTGRITDRNQIVKLAQMIKKEVEQSPEKISFAQRFLDEAATELAHRDRSK